uniref:Cytochrome c biogenesis protein transmembrane region n=1 Tax=Riquetophycus sp. TaxID=1897556 RepID=A0A1C9C889_9FLOR|nr:cytochrome c biogenesis protein transmembrane region [Riquetophycus sp.]
MQNIWNYINISLYCLEQYINSVITNDIKHFTISTFILLLISGIITSINPCSISILPLAMSYISSHNKVNNTYKYRQYSIILGTTSSFIIMLILSCLFNTYYTKLSAIIPIMTSCYMIIIGLNLLSIIDLNFDFLKLRIKNLQFISYNYSDIIIRDYIIGCLIGLNSSSCSTPVLAITMFWILHSQSITLGIIYIICYSLGYIIPMLIVIEFTTKYTNMVNINVIWNYIMPLGGCFILGLGVFSLLNLTFI